MRKLYFSVWALFLLSIFIFASCDKNISTTPEDSSVAVGKIIFDSNPRGAQIFINGDNTGKITPDSMIHLEPGFYRTIYHFPPYLDIQDSVFINENSTVLFKNFYEDTRNYGRIICRSDPSGAWIIVNDSSTGFTTPTTLESLWPSRYKVTCSLNEHRDETKYISITGGSTKDAFFNPQDTSQCVDYNYSNSNFPAIHSACVAVDKDGAKWIGNNPGGLVKYYKGEWTYFTLGNSPLPHNVITCIEVDDQNNKWIGTPLGLAKIDSDGNWTVIGQPQLDRILAIEFDNLGNTWIASLSSGTRRNLIRYNNDQWEEFGFPAGKLIMSLTCDNENRIWAGLSQGMAVLENGQWITPPGNYAGADWEVSHFMVNSIKYDQRGFIWIGMGGQQSGPGFMYIFDGSNYNRFTLPQRYISHIHIAENQNVWVSCLGRYPNAYASNTTPVLLKISPDFSISEYTVESTKIASKLLMWSASDLNGDLWIASRNKGIIKFKRANL